jgi:hypothetical protein
MEIKRVEEKGVLFGTNVDYIFKLKKNIDEIEDELDKNFIKLIFTKSTDLNDFLKSLSGPADASKKDFILKEIKLSDLTSKSGDIALKNKKIADFVEKYSVEKKYIEKSSGKYKLIIFGVFLAAVFVIVGFLGQ